MNYLTAKIGHGLREPRSRGQNPSTPRGFTLTEALLAMVIVGTGILASLQLFGTCTEENLQASRATTGRMLAENIREAMAACSFCDPVSAATVWGPEAGEILASYDDIDDFDGPQAKGSVFNPPIDATRTQIPQLGAFTQTVSVMPVNPDDPGNNSDEANPTLPKGAYTGALRVRVKVTYKSSATAPAIEVYSTSWVRVNNK